MFENIGEKIKKLAIFCTVSGCLISVVSAIVCWCFAIVWAGFTVLIIGCLLSWVGAFTLYGFGELISQTTKAAKAIQNLQMLSVYQSSKNQGDKASDMIEEIQNEAISDYESEKRGYVDESEEINIPNDDECPACFGKIGPKDKECPHCGYKLK